MFGSLPDRIQKAAKTAYALFQKDPSHPSLNHHALNDTKKGQHQKGSYAVSVTARYRAIYVKDGSTNIWYWIGSHEDYNSFTGKK